jgi:hypothetical protein
MGQLLSDDLVCVDSHTRQQLTDCLRHPRSLCYRSPERKLRAHGSTIHQKARPSIP